MAEWKYTVNLKDIFHNDALSFEEKRDGIVQRVWNSKWVKEAGDGFIGALLSDLGNSMDDRTFNYYWNELYDWADDDRVWIETG